jgi:hypothetical protein
VCGGVEGSRQDWPPPEPAHNPGLNSAAGEGLGKRFGFCTLGGVGVGGWEEAGNESRWMERRRVGANDSGVRGDGNLEHHRASPFFMSRIPFETGLSPWAERRSSFPGEKGCELRRMSVEVMDAPVYRAEASRSRSWTIHSEDSTGRGKRWELPHPETRLGVGPASGWGRSPRPRGVSERFGGFWDEGSHSSGL